MIDKPGVDEEKKHGASGSSSAARVSIVVKRSFPCLARFSIDSSNRGEVSTMVGVPIRISYSNADSIHGNIMGYDGEWRDHAHDVLSRRATRDAGWAQRAFARSHHGIGPTDEEDVDTDGCVSAKTETHVGARSNSLR